ICVFFFFQAEDGIRDLIVTGVQTCALPISRLATAGRYQARFFSNGFTRLATSNTIAAVPALTIGDVTKTEGNSGTSNAVFTVTRSEERRVGKEGRDGWWRRGESGERSGERW